MAERRARDLATASPEFTPLVYNSAGANAQLRVWGEIDIERTEDKKMIHIILYLTNQTSPPPLMCHAWPHNFVYFFKVIVTSGSNTYYSEELPCELGYSHRHQMKVPHFKLDQGYPEHEKFYISVELVKIRSKSMHDEDPSIQDRRIQEVKLDFGPETLDEIARIRSVNGRFTDNTNKEFELPQNAGEL
ncbi:hypothetical protein BGW36DRAFT_433517 [Talaromyces proteolyticus]|uniref:Uncharacterized protein n=1 Tax=Talaromyces proteolyticus TaxID=1131652 RepID=A0AAD4PSR6_9EURO|nr:uncharacterized protein BGW36DRAFT_433517 [Talaromyces proteolyticus]KAH8689518.1 hypothetical protein BGW36DRAFT_433517 [Talaromyces proteolyticus]